MVSIYLLGYAFGPLFLAPLSEIYGRLPIYRICMVTFLLTNIACALSVNMPMLIIFRLLTGLAGACPLTIGPASVADCFSQQERGRAMAIWNMPVLLGPSLGPAVGAYVSRGLGWRWNFWLLIIMVRNSLLMVLYLGCTDMCYRLELCLLSALSSKKRLIIQPFRERSSRHYEKSVTLKTYRPLHRIDNSSKEVWLAH